MNTLTQKTQQHVTALGKENSLQGFTIDGYEVEFTKRVALMPVDLVAQPADNEPKSKVQP